MIVCTDDLYKGFGQREALRGLSLSVPEGSAYALIGPNGAGKTTAIRVLMNILRAERGSARVLGIDSDRLSARELRQIGYVSENQQLPGRLRVHEYLEYLRPFYPAWDRQLEASVLADLRLPADARIGELSHGMRIKAALACALPFKPRLLVLDEPFSGLDALVRDEFMERLLEQAGDMTLLISSHELAEIEHVATHVGFIDAGRLVFQECMSELTGRVREVRVTLEGHPVPPTPLPDGCMQLDVAGNVVTFMDTRFSDERLAGIVAAHFKGIRHVDVRPVALRSIFTTLARAARDGEY